MSKNYFLTKYCRYIRHHMFAILFFLSFLFWMYSFRGFLLGRLCLTEEAVIYYEHIKFFLDHLSCGIFPLWDPTRDGGIPNEFFLRRIGEFNPCYLFIILLNKAGLSYTSAHLFFLAGYYFLGMMGFYFIAKGIFQNRSLAFLAYLLLLFSSLGARLFDNYLLLTFIPMIWFFFFLLAFAKEQKKRSFLGMTFTLMVISTTYIPLYFITILLLFVVCFCLIFLSSTKVFLTDIKRFLSRNKFFAVCCGVALLLSLMPGLIFFQEAGGGDILLPGRHTVDAPVKNILGLSRDRTMDGGIVVPIIFDDIFSDLKQIRLATFYFPVFTYLLFLLGAVVAVTRKSLLFFVWGMFLFFLVMGDAMPFHGFLYSHIPYFKYFRNLHYFIWVILLPLGILFLVEQARLFFALRPRQKWCQWFLLAFIMVVHGVMTIICVNFQPHIFSSFIVIGFSLLFFLNYFLRPAKFLIKTGDNNIDTMPFLFSLFALVACQPLEVYSYLQGNAEKRVDAYRYDRPYLTLPVNPTQEEQERSINFDFPNDIQNHLPPRRYIDTRWGDLLRQNIPGDVLVEYLRFKFILYDHVEPEDGAGVRRIVQAMARNENTAFIANFDRAVPPWWEENTVRTPRAHLMSTASKDFQLLAYDVNSVKVRTNFQRPKFLIYNDNFYGPWQASINEKRTFIFRSNISFKGIFLPAGMNVVDFQYGTTGMYFLKFSLWGLFLFIFIILVASCVKVKDGFQQPHVSGS